MFDEYSEEAETLEKWFEGSLKLAADMWDITYKDPIHDIARRFLNEIVEFEPLEKDP